MERAGGSYEVDGFRIEVFHALGNMNLSVVCTTCRVGVLARSLADLDNLGVTHGPGVCDGYRMRPAP